MHCGQWVFIGLTGWLMSRAAVLFHKGSVDSLIRSRSRALSNIQL
jgi:hypothetical protein